MLHDAVSDDMSSFDWRFNMMVGALTEGRFVTYIHRNAAGQPTDLYPMPNATASILPNGRKQYKTTGNGESKTYDQSDVLDVTFMLKGDMVSHRSPLRQCAIAIGKAHNANKYGSKLFENGGLPAFTLQGPFSSGTSAQRASNDIAEATKRAAKNGGTVLAIPEGHKLEPLSSSPDKMQLVETQRFAVEEIARIYSLPPTFLQDLTHGTFNNTEQQDLHFVKHTMKRWLEQLEAEMNLKLFGRGSNRIVEFNLDGLLRGDYKTRMEGNAQAINTGQLTPDEARAQENREPLPGGDRLYIQGATVPLEKQNGVTQDEP
jgi:HK97 family phage portal protein